MNEHDYFIYFEYSISFLCLPLRFFHFFHLTSNTIVYCCLSITYTFFLLIISIIPKHLIQRYLFEISLPRKKYSVFVGYRYHKLEIDTPIQYANQC